MLFHNFPIKTVEGRRKGCLFEGDAYLKVWSIGEVLIQGVHIRVEALIRALTVIYFLCSSKTIVMF